MVHIIKALAQHPGAAQSLTDDDSLQLLFDVVAVKPNIQSAKDASSMKFSFSCVHLHQQALQVHFFFPNEVKAWQFPNSNLNVLADSRTPSQY